MLACSVHDFLNGQYLHYRGPDGRVQYIYIFHDLVDKMTFECI